MNKRAQELNIGAIFLSSIAAIVSLIMAARMGASIFYRIFIALLTLIVAYVITWKILEGG